MSHRLSHFIRTFISITLRISRTLISSQTYILSLKVYLSYRTNENSSKYFTPNKNNQKIIFLWFFLSHIVDKCVVSYSAINLIIVAKNIFAYCLILERRK
jgi:hypothetical protein